MASEAAEIRQAIEETRAQLGETVQALAHKADVKAQITKKVDHVKERSVSQAQDALHKVVEVTRPAVAAVPPKNPKAKMVALPVMALVTLLALAWVRARRQGRGDAPAGPGLPSVLTGG